MADTTHYVRARKGLEELPGGKDAVAIDASLAVSTATREVTASVIAQTREFATRLHDIATALEPDAGLVRFDGHGADILGNEDVPVYVSPSHVALVLREKDDRTRIVAVGSDPLIVRGGVHDVAAKLGVSA